MDNKSDLILKLESLEEENRLLKKILGESLNQDNTGVHNSSAISGAFDRAMIETSFHREFLNNAGVPADTVQTAERLSNEKYISALSRKLNSLADEKSVLKTVLQDLLIKSNARYIYYIQLDESSCIISSILPADNADTEDIFSFQEFSSSRSDLNIKLDDLYDIGNLTLNRKPGEMFFSTNRWVSPDIKSALLIPVIVQNEILGIIIIDTSGNESGITPVDIMLYQTVSSIVTGSLKRIAYENRIRDRKERYELIIENTAHLLFQTLPDGTITFANRRFAEFFGTTSSELNGRQIKEIALRDQGSVLSLMKSLSGITGTFESEISITDYHNSERIIRLSVNPVLSESGNILLFNFLGEDITEKKYLQNELLTTKKRLDLAFLASNDAYWDANLLTGEFFYSQNFYRMLDYDSSEMPSLFRDFLKLVHSEDVPLIKNIAKKCFSGEIIRTSIRFRAVTSHGDYKWIYSRMMIIESDKKGSPTRLIGTNVDLTATVKIEEKLKESETRLKMILDNMPVMLDAIDESGIIIHWNRECEHVTGYSAEEIINNPDARRLLYTDEKERKFFFKMPPEHGGNYRNMESTLVSKSGIKKTILWSNLSDLYPVPGWHSWAVGIDITPLKEAREALSESTYKLREAQRIARLGYWEYDHKQAVFTWEGTLSKMIGYDDKPMMIPENEMLNFIHEEDRKRIAKSFYRCIRDREIHNDIIRYLTKSGETIFVRQTSKTDYDSSGTPLFTRGICFDITELKKTELELVKAKVRAEESDRLKSAFLANMSHEARTPLNSIMGFSELLCEKGVSEEDKVNYAGIIRESSRQLTSLISDIIDISKIDAKLMVITKKPVRLNRIISHICGVFRNEVKGRPVEVSCSKEFDDNSDAIITDETRLQQILNNLIYNALKFTESGTVSFGYTLTEDRKFIQFHVEDSGIGIPKNRQKMIFGRFKQADVSIAKKYGGTGLGLSICRELSRLLGGKIWVRSEVNKGSTFYFKIPYETAGSVELLDNETVIKQKEYGDFLKNRKILIVDDNRSVHTLLAAIFRKYEALPLSSETAAEAIARITGDDSIDIVLLDIQLPDIDGTVAVKKLKEIRPTLPVIAQTANALEDDRRRYLELGFDGYISKPYNREELLRTVCSLINNSQN
jgi:PAS domain S-box-containing protein